MTEEGTLKWDGLDAAVIGYIDRCGEGPIVIYSEVKMMKISHRLIR